MSDRKMYEYAPGAYVGVTVQRNLKQLEELIAIANTMGVTRHKVLCMAIDRGLPFVVADAKRRMDAINMGDNPAR